MLLLLLAFRRLLLGLIEGFKDPEFQALGIAVLLLIGVGTIFYSSVEHWKILDSFYFTVVTLATVGYGDFVPHTDEGKIFTVIYIFIGMGTIVSFITLLAKKIKRDRPFLKK